MGENKKIPKEEAGEEKIDSEKLVIKTKKESSQGYIKRKSKRLKKT